jgi:hypothetical protein
VRAATRLAAARVRSIASNAELVDAEKAIAERKGRTFTAQLERLFAQNPQVSPRIFLSQCKHSVILVGATGIEPVTPTMSR